jgi:hypothetical protein
VGGWATIIENLGSMGIINVQMVKGLHAIQQKGSFKLMKGNQSSLLTKRKEVLSNREEKNHLGVVSALHCM